MFNKWIIINSMIKTTFKWEDGILWSKTLKDNTWKVDYRTKFTIMNEEVDLDFILDVLMDGIIEDAVKSGDLYD